MIEGPSLPPTRLGLRARHGTRRRNATPETVEALERLTALETAVENLTQTRAENTTALSEIVDRVDKQVVRVGKEQFKANALAESQQKNVETMLDQLRDSAAYRERELAQLRERLGEAGNEGRLDVVRRLLPALDGLEEALASGKRLLQRMADAASAPPPPSSFWQKLMPAQKISSPPEPSSSQAIAAWLEGLTFVQERLLEALAAVDVTPIRTEGSAFDPHLHVAVETIPATGQIAPGMIARENRRGYARGETVLRYAEVVVARSIENASRGEL